MSERGICQGHFARAGYEGTQSKFPGWLRGTMMSPAQGRATGCRRVLLFGVLPFVFGIWLVLITFRHQGQPSRLPQARGETQCLFSRSGLAAPMSRLQAVCRPQKGAKVWLKPHLSSNLVTARSLYCSIAV